MNNDQDRNGPSRHKLELVLAQDLDRLCDPANNVGVQRLATLKEQLLALFLRLEEEPSASAPGRRGSVNVREEISKLIWSLEDWQMQFEGRN